MKITTETPDLLIVEDRPVVLAVLLILFILIFVGVGMAVVASGEWIGLFFGLAGGGLGFVAFAVFVRRVQVVFHRPGAWVELRRRSLFGARTERHALADVARAELEETYGSKGGRLYRVALVLERGHHMGRHPLTEAYSSGAGHARAAAAINAWLSAETA